MSRIAAGWKARAPACFDSGLRTQDFLNFPPLPTLRRFDTVQAMKRSFALVLMALLAAASATLAQGPDDQYVRIYNLIQEADSFKSGGQTSQAMAKYLEAQTSLQRFQRGYPE